MEKSDKFATKRVLCVCVCADDTSVPTVWLKNPILLVYQCLSGLCVWSHWNILGWLLYHSWVWSLFKPSDFMHFTAKQLSRTSPAPRGDLWWCSAFFKYQQVDLAPCLNSQCLEPSSGNPSDWQRFFFLLLWFVLCIKHIPGEHWTGNFSVCSAHSPIQGGIQTSIRKLLVPHDSIGLWLWYCYKTIMPKHRYGIWNPLLNIFGSKAQVAMIELLYK